MKRDYRYAAYAIIASALLLLAAGAIAVSDVGAETPGDPPDGQITLGVDNVTDSRTKTIDVTLVDGSGNFTPGDRTCVASTPDLPRTDVKVDGVTVTLIEHREGEPFDRISRDRFVRLVWNEVSRHAGLDEYDHVRIHVVQYYEYDNTGEREQPRDTVGITVRPADDCLPTVRGEAHIDNETVDVESSFSELRSLNLTFTDRVGVLDRDEQELVETLVKSNDRASYNVQRLFDDPGQLEASVIEATNDGHVDIELTSHEDDEVAVGVTVDLDNETVIRSWTVAKVNLSGNATAEIDNRTIVKSQMEVGVVKVAPGNETDSKTVTSPSS